MTQYLTKGTSSWYTLTSEKKPWPSESIGLSLCSPWYLHGEELTWRLGTAAQWVVMSPFAIHAPNSVVHSTLRHARGGWAMLVSPAKPPWSRRQCRGDPIPRVMCCRGQAPYKNRQFQQESTQWRREQTTSAINTTSFGHNNTDNAVYQHGVSADTPTTSRCMTSCTYSSGSRLVNGHTP